MWRMLSFAITRRPVLASKQSSIQRISGNDALCILTNYGLHDRGAIFRVSFWARFFYSSLCSGSPWGLVIPIFRGHRTGPFHRGLNGRGMNSTIHLHLVSRSRMCEWIHPVSCTCSLIST
jgi:hypothetical protein